MSNVTLEKNYEYVINNKSEFMNRYFNKYIIVVVGEFDDTTSAMIFALSKYEAGTFLIQHMVEAAFEPMVFHTRVAYE